MEAEAELILETAPEPVADIGPNRVLPFSFAKRHGILIRSLSPEGADTVCRPGATALTVIL